MGVSHHSGAPVWAAPTPSLRLCVTIECLKNKVTWKLTITIPMKQNTLPGMRLRNFIVFSSAVQTEIECGRLRRSSSNSLRNKNGCRKENH